VLQELIGLKNETGKDNIWFGGLRKHRDLAKHDIWQY
jgi:hypothetical protein